MLKDRLAHKFADFLGSWKFIFLYSALMFSWVYLHSTGHLQFDTPDFVRWNLLMTYFTGIQAALLLMSESKKEAMDRKRDEDAYRTTKETLARTLHLVKQVSVLENIVEEMTSEIKSKKEREKQ